MSITGTLASLAAARSRSGTNSSLDMVTSSLCASAQIARTRHVAGISFFSYCAGKSRL
jgi:hypothetical protein